MFRTRIADDLDLLVRTVEPADKAHLLAGFSHLSERSRFFRFLGGVTRLSEKDLVRFTARSNSEHCAIGALNMSVVPPDPVAIARYERLDTDQESAEMAVTVIDAYQGRGVGPLLIGAIAFCAAEAGIKRFVAYVHPENRGMIQLMISLGAHIADAAEGEITFDMPLHRDAGGYPDTRAGKQMRLAYDLMAHHAPESAARPTG
ncbi:N-acetyltransferase [Georhizobium profundi]|jgi:RimJ/RimL family protein N-acetyltransferase|uniref:N-acetyltransferase n=1 Tax=Georhizobium profundi TaxID=2341112 RepID=A0A3S9B0P3_9HYPH|nr:GNAT family N-acetyltransferase [Georhizobium profundi]AZN70536.1 N-acetyltransferase [Georhizobium profundi]